jgi:hypothetical protein
MKKHYLLPFLQGACFILISLLLQNCGGPGNLPLEGEEELTTIELEEQGRRKRARIEVREEEQLVLIEQGEGMSCFDIFPSEIWQEIFSYLDFEGVLSARAVNRDWSELITGFRKVGIVGVENKPSHIIDARSWVKREEINFRDNKLKELTSATIPSFAFYHLMGHVKSLRKELWSHLPATQVHTLDLGNNKIGDAGAIELAKALSATRVHTLNLRGNQIGATGAIELVKALSDTQVHTLNLSYNQIGAAGALELAKALPRAQVHTVVLAYNQIGATGARELAKALPKTQVHTLDLEANQIGAVGASELAKALPATQMHTLNLAYNQIGKTTQQLLVEQYPHIKWAF